MKPIEKPKSLFLRLLYALSRRRFGKVITPLKTIYSRRPALLGFSLKIEGRMKKLSISHRLAVQVRTLVAIERSCGFCIDIGRYEMLEAGVSPEQADSLWEYQDSPHFSQREKAAFDFANCIVHNPANIQPFREKLISIFSEKEAIDIAWVCAAESYYNVMNKAMGLESNSLCAIPARTDSNKELVKA